jgi:selenocysteine-specific elongation factor
VILGTAGHIDHGKTTLIGALTGVNTDRLPEEKRRGITIELGFAPLTLEGVGTIGVVDVPGHEAFVRTMVAGATGIDLALLVIAADEGVMPQTREHLAILGLLGVRRGVVALTKADLVDDEWLALVEEDVRAATADALPDAAIVPVSAQSGRGLPELRAALADVARTVPPRSTDDLFRLPVDRAFTIKGTGTVVTGTVWTGHARRDENLRILPAELPARVRGVQGHGAQLDDARPGVRAALALAGVEVADIARGSTLVSDREWRTTTMARADVTLVPDLDVAVRPRTWYRFHVGTSEVGVRIIAREQLSTNATGVRLVLDSPVVLRAGDRFVIRTSAPLNTIAGGVITDPYSPKRARPWPADLSAADRLDRLVEEAAGQGLDATSLPVRLGLSPADCRTLAATANERFVTAAGRLVSGTAFQELQRQLLADVTAFHSSHPLEPGIPQQSLKARLHASPAVAEAAFNEMWKTGTLTGQNGLVCTREWSPTPTPDQARLAETLVAALTLAGAEPPSVTELTEQNGAETPHILRFLERASKVTQVEPDRYYETSQLKLLITRLREAMTAGKEVGPSELREELGLSRKFLIPFLEYCDRVGYTNRSAGGRVWKDS